MGVSDREDDDVRRGRDDGDERRRRKKDEDDEEEEDAVRKERDDRKRDGGGRSRSRKSSTRDRRKRKDDDNNKRKRKKEREEQSDDDDSSDDDNDDDDSKGERNDKDRKRKKKKSSRRRESSRSRRHRRDKKRTSKGRKKKPRKKYSSSSSSSSDDDSSSSSSSSSSDSSDGRNKSSSKKKKVINERLLAKLNARGETLEERNERRSQKRAANIQARFGYTAEENPFNDPNLHETFTWKKRKDAESAAAKNVKGGGEDNKKKSDTLAEIETIRRRRKERDEERDEMERIRAEELKMKEYENYDEWAKKEEEFHLEQQRKRSAIRLVEGREKPIDVLAKNLLLFGLSDQEKKTRAAVKYQERYNALDQLDKLDAELEEPYKLIRVLKLSELKELLTDIDAFRMLEKQTAASINNLEEDGGNENESSKSSIVLYWDALHLVTQNEIMILEKGGDKGAFAKKIEDIKGIFQGQSRSALDKMKSEVDAKIRKSYHGGGDIDRTYWASVQDQLMVYLAMMDLKELHSKMLVRQLERLEQRKQEQLQRAKDGSSSANDDQKKEGETEAAASSMVPKNVSPDFGNDEEEIGENDEVNVANGDSSKATRYPWQDKYKPRKPRYFNRVKTGYDWNKYNQTHYDSENPPPKTVQGYKFNIFYPDLVDPTKTPSYHMEPADNDDFCILRFHAGAPYEDVAFKIINREWNRSRKRGFRCTFERGVLSLYFNFTTHWYRR